ncbi:MAG: glycosyltransferase [Pseudomonadota bacterium]
MLEAISCAVLVPTFNAEGTIEQTLSSLQSNSRIDHVSRVVLIDNCSTDKTEAVAKACWNSKTPLDVWVNEKNLGVYGSKNLALNRLADLVDWTFILHSDDMAKPNWLQVYLDAIEQVPPTVASISSSYDIWKSDIDEITPGEDVPDGAVVQIPGTSEHVLNTVRMGCWWQIGGCCIRNKLFREIGDFDVSLSRSGDWDWLLRCLSMGYGIWYIPRSTVWRREHANALSAVTSRSSEDILQELQVLRNLKQNDWLDAPRYRAEVRRLMLRVSRRVMSCSVRGNLPASLLNVNLLIKTSMELRNVR